MTEEEQELVAKAALCGARFEYRNGYWRRSTAAAGGMHTITRAAIRSLFELKVIGADDERRLLRKYG